MQIDILAGRLIFPNGTTVNATLIANTLFLTPFDIPVPVSIDQLVVQVATAAAGATTGGVNPEIGIYVATPNGDSLENIIRAPLDASSLTTTGRKDVDLPAPYSLPRGRVWLAFYNPTYATTQPTLLGNVSTTLNSLDVNTLPGTTSAVVAQSRQARVGPLASGMPARLDATAFSFADNLSIPLIALRVASVGIAPAVNPIPAASLSGVALAEAVDVPRGTQAALTPSLTALPTGLPTTLK